MKIRYLFSVLQRVYTRFPVAGFLFLAFYIISAFPIEKKFFLLMTGPSAFLAVSAVLLGESLSWTYLRKTIASLITSLLVVGFVFWTGLTKEASGFMVLCGLSFMSVFAAPFLFRQKDDSAFWLFGYRLSVRILQTLLICFVLFLGGSAIYASLNYLFAMNLPEQSVLQIWLFLACIAGPLYTMAGIPENFADDEIEKATLIKAQCVIQAYILVPLMVIYAAILYSYAVMIGLKTELPKGGVANMVSGFAIVGTAVYFTAYGVRNAYPALNSYIRYFFKLLILPLILLAIAIWVRIHEYGVTEERYYVALGFFFFISAFFIDLFSKSSKLVPIFSLCLALLLLSIIPPMSAGYISLHSQESRLQEILTGNNLLTDGKIKKATQDLNFKTRKDISSILDYLERRRKLDRVKKWTDLREVSSASIIMKEMGLEYVPRYTTEAEVNNNLSYTSDRFGSRVITVTGFDESFDINVMPAKSEDFKLPEVPKPPVYRGFSFTDLQEMHIYKNGKPELVFDMKFLQNDFPVRGQEFSLISKDGRGKIIVNYMHAEKKGDQKIVTSLGGILLVKNR